MTRILFVIHTSTVFAEPFRLAKLLLRDGIEPVFAFAYQHWSAESFSDECSAAGIAVYRPQQGGTAARVYDNAAHVARVLRERWPSVLTGLAVEFIGLLRSLSAARRLFDTVDPQLLVMSIDIAGYDTGAYIKIASARPQGASDLLDYVGRA